MKLIRIARNALIGRALFELVAARRRAAAQGRRTRRLGGALLAACGAGAGLVAFRVLRSRPERESDREPEQPAAAVPAGRGPGAAGPRATPEAPLDAPAKLRARAMKAAPPSVKKQRKRARRAEAEQREEADRREAHGGPVKLEVNQTPDLRAPLAELIKS